MSAEGLPGAEAGQLQPRIFEARRREGVAATPHGSGRSLQVRDSCDGLGALDIPHVLDIPLARLRRVRLEQYSRQS